MVSIAGAGIAAPRPGEDVSLQALVFHAASAALVHAGVDRDAIDGVCIAASDALDGRAISSMLLACGAGAYLKEEIKVSDEGTLAFAAAALKIEAGLARRVLVVSWARPTESDPVAALGVNSDPVFWRPVGLHPLVVEAIGCQRFIATHGLDAARFDAVAERLGARPAGDGDRVSWPLRWAHMPPATDGAAALVLSAEPGPVDVRAWGVAVDDADPVRRADAGLGSLAAIGQRVFADAGVRPDADVAIETTDRNVFRLVMATVGLGIRSPRDALDELARRDLPSLNPSGGLWASNPPTASGLERLVHASDLVRSGAHRAAIVHSSFGMAGQGNLLAALVRP